MIPALAFLVPSFAILATPSEPSDDHVRVSLACETDGVEPGKTLTIAATFDLDKDWHIYWPGQNDTGQPPKFDTAKFPEGVTLGEISWPVPRRQVLPGDIVDHIYEKRAVVLLAVNVAPSVKPGTVVTLEMPIEWMECSTTCRLGGATGRTEFRVVERGLDLKHGPGKAIVEAARKALPQPLAADSPVKIEVSGDAVKFTAPGADALTFMPHVTSRELADPANGASAKGGALTATLKADKSKLREKTPVIGILSVVTGQREAHYRIDTTPKSEKKSEIPVKPSVKPAAEGTPAKR